MESIINNPNDYRDKIVTLKGTYETTYIVWRVSEILVDSHGYKIELTNLNKQNRQYFSGSDYKVKGTIRLVQCCSCRSIGINYGEVPVSECREVSFGLGNCTENSFVNKPFLEVIDMTKLS